MRFEPLRSAVQRGLYALGWELRRARPRLADGSARYSSFHEQEIIDDLLKRLPVEDEFCVDIGASDGEALSNSYSLFRSGWRGLALECDGRRFASLAYRYRPLDVDLVRCRVTPDNVLPLLDAHDVPQKFGLLSLDIDGYDYYVLERILGTYRPYLLCIEINEKIPPPVKFTIRPDPDFTYRGDQFYGHSIALLAELAGEHAYALVGLEYSNAFLVPREVNPVPERSAEEAYREGYRERADRLEHLPWNRAFEPLLTMPPDEALAFVKNAFSRYEGSFICEL